METLDQKKVATKEKKESGVNKLDLGFKKIQENVYKSIDGAKMTSTILNIDLDVKQNPKI